MGRIIRKHASAIDVMVDAQDTHNNALARGGVWQELAEQRLGPVLAVYSAVNADHTAASQLAGQRVATRNARNKEADGLLGRISDELWNAVGRPANDPAFALLFPGGYGYYAGGELETQPHRMELLAKLLTANLHPKLDAARAQAAALEIRAAATALRDAIEAAREVVIEAELLDRVRVAVARTAATELANLKRLYKSAGFSEAEIHQVIPHRPRKSPSAKPEPPQP